MYRPTTRTGSPRRSGFTLVELAVVLAIIAVIAALSTYGWTGVRARVATQSAAYTLDTALSTARARAVSRGHDVWVIVFPEGGHDGEGPGAYFLYDDPDLSFGRASAVPGELTYADFTPRNTGGASGRLLAATFLSDLPGQRTAFTVPMDAWFKAPFNALGKVTAACSFCSNDKGAIVFSSSGSARFVDGTGAVVGARSGGLALQDGVDGRVFLFAVAAATGYSEVQTP